MVKRISPPVRTTADVEDVTAKPAASDNPHAVESLADLAKEAATLQTPEPAADAVTKAAPGTTQDLGELIGVKDLVNILEMARNMAEPMLVEMKVFKPGQLADIWNAKQLEMIAEPLVEICSRHGLEVGEALEAFGPYFGLIVGVTVPALATWKAIRMNAIELAAHGQQQPA